MPAWFYIFEAFTAGMAVGYFPMLWIIIDLHKRAR